MVKVNRNVKDRLFRILFREKRDLLSLYNAVNGTSYEDPEALEVNTLEDAVFVGMKNDISFIIGDIMSVYEHQSTLNPNIPLRGLFYVTDLYRGYLEQHNISLHQSTKIKLPCPQFLVFYNGTHKASDRFTMKLSEAFSVRQENDEECLEFSVTFLNVNLGHNQKLLEKCRRLKEYSLFIAKIRENIKKGMLFKQAVETSVEECIEEGILTDFLRKNRGEVLQAVWYDFDEEKYIKNEKELSRQDGIRKGIHATLQLCRKFNMSDEETETYLMEQFSLTREEAEKMQKDCDDELWVEEADFDTMWYDFYEENCIENAKELSRQDGIREGIQQGIQQYIALCQEMKMDEEEIVMRIIDKFSVERKDVENYLKDGFV